MKMLSLCAVQKGRSVYSAPEHLKCGECYGGTKYSISLTLIILLVLCGLSFVYTQNVCTKCVPFCTSSELDQA